MPPKRKEKKETPPSTPLTEPVKHESFQNPDGTWRNPYPHPPFLWESPAKQYHREACAERDEVRQEERATRMAAQKVVCQY
jgi:hypothetical protein